MEGGGIWGFWMSKIGAPPRIIQIWVPLQELSKSGHPCKNYPNMGAPTRIVQIWASLQELTKSGFSPNSFLDNVTL